MKILIVFAHPNQKSYAHSIVEQLKEVSLQRNDQVKTLDLYKEKYNPVLESSDFEQHSKTTILHQDLISWADRITLVYPIWWGQMPAMLKGFLDKTLSYGFAFTTDNKGKSVGLLGDKQVYCIVNSGMEESVQISSGINDAVEKLHLINNFVFCGVTRENCKIKFFYNVPKQTEENLVFQLKNIENWF